MKNKIILSIDLESFVHGDIYASNGRCSSERKKQDNKYIIKSTKKILKLLEQFKARATFFVLGELYEWYPDLIEEIANNGHEVAFHSYDHTILKTAASLSEQIKKADAFIARFKPIGFRSPAMFLKKDMLDVLHSNDFIYDSSVYDARNILEFKTSNGHFFELPVSSYNYANNSNVYFPKPLEFKLLMNEFPFGSGFFIGLLGKRLDFFIRKTQRQNMIPILMMHPWQILERPSQAGFLKTAYLIKHPLFIPYSFYIEKSLLNILKANESISIRDFLKVRELI
jgi:hypothetical protein